MPASILSNEIPCCCTESYFDVGVIYIGLGVTYININSHPVNSMSLARSFFVQDMIGVHCTGNASSRMVCATMRMIRVRSIELHYLHRIKVIGLMSAIV